MLPIWGFIIKDNEYYNNKELRDVRQSCYCSHHKTRRQARHQMEVLPVINQRIHRTLTNRRWCPIRTHNARLSTDQKVMAHDKYHTVDKVIRHKMSTTSSDDGHCQQRKVKEQWGKSRERAVFPNAFCVCSNRKWKRGERWASGESWDSNLMVSECKNHRQNRSLTRLPPLLLQFSLLTVTISRWRRWHLETWALSPLAPGLESESELSEKELNPVTLYRGWKSYAPLG